MDTQTQDTTVKDAFDVLRLLRRLMALMVNLDTQSDMLERVTPGDDDWAFLMALFHPASSGDDVGSAADIVYKHLQHVIVSDYADTHIGGMVYGMFFLADALVKRAASEPTFEALIDEVAVQMWTYNPAQAKALGLPEPNPGNGTDADGLPFA